MKIVELLLEKKEKMFYLVTFLFLLYTQISMGSAANISKQNNTALLQAACDKAVHPGTISVLRTLLASGLEFSANQKNIATKKLQETLNWYEDNKEQPPPSIEEALNLLNTPAKPSE